MFGISFEHILIVGVILLIVGPRRLPELGNTMGKAIKNFKDSFNGVEEASYRKLDEKKPAAGASAKDTAPASTIADKEEATIISSNTQNSAEELNTRSNIPGSHV